MSINVDAKGYEPGKPVFITIAIPADAKGCKGRYAIEVFQRGRMVREVRGLNYDLGSPDNDTHVLLEAGEAVPTGALARVLVMLQQTAAPKFSFTVTAQQGKEPIARITDAGDFVAGQILTREYDLFLV